MRSRAPSPYRLKPRPKVYAGAIERSEAERWVPAAGFPSYLVSDQGRVARIIPSWPTHLVGRLLQPTRGNGGRFITMVRGGIGYRRDIETLQDLSFDDDRAINAQRLRAKEFAR